ncbi:MAG: YggS family pyridoxal phosphate-dependent enzyme [Phycisphaerae bacterium]|nr:YggS family pyridoxal phosphate-dependent enzyme [Phycisphaerae bacterium]
MSTAIMPDTLQARYQTVCERIARAAEHSGRKFSDVILVAVTKHADPEQIKTLLQLGHRDFGENKAQMLIQHAAIVEEFFSRQLIHQTTRKVRSAEASEMLFRPATGVGLSPHVGQPNSKDGLRWHMIGHLQRNKAKKVADIARLIHSLDSLRLAEELQAIAVRKDQPIDVLLQVNCSGEASKFGCLPAAAIPLAEQLCTMINVRLRGLMTMAAPTDKPDEARETFARCRELFEEMQKEGFDRAAPFNILSMGMSGDYEAAIAEGANIVRVGTAIFGDTPTPRVEEPEEREDPED